MIERDRLGTLLVWGIVALLMGGAAIVAVQTTHHLEAQRRQWSAANLTACEASIESAKAMNGLLANEIARCAEHLERLKQDCGR